MTSEIKALPKDAPVHHRIAQFWRAFTEYQQLVWEGKDDGRTPPKMSDELASAMVERHFPGLKSVFGGLSGIPGPVGPVGPAGPVGDAVVQAPPPAPVAKPTAWSDPIPAADAAPKPAELPYETAKERYLHLRDYLKAGYAKRFVPDAEWAGIPEEMFQTAITTITRYWSQVAPKDRSRWEAPSDAEVQAAKVAGQQAMCEKLIEINLRGKGS